MILVVGAKGGVGTTTAALSLIRALRGVGLDAADGTLAARLDRPTYLLAHVALLGRGAFQEAVDHVVRRGITLLWTPECAFLADPVRAFVRAVDERRPVVVDGGIEPPRELADGWAGTVVIVSIPDHPVAQYHERRLLSRFPGALVARDFRKIQELLPNLAGWR